MPEDSVNDRVISTVRAASSTGHTILYTITKGNDDELFDLDFTTGKNGFFILVYYWCESLSWPSELVHIYVYMMRIHV